MYRFRNRSCSVVGMNIEQQQERLNRAFEHQKRIETAQARKAELEVELDNARKALDQTYFDAIEDGFSWREVQEMSNIVTSTLQNAVNRVKKRLKAQGVKD